MSLAIGLWSIGNVRSAMIDRRFPDGYSQHPIAFMKLYLDQFGNKWFARTVADLRKQIGGTVSKMYRDEPDGSIVHIGYVVGGHWCTAYVPFEVKQ